MMPGMTKSIDQRKMKSPSTMDSRMTFPAKGKASNRLSYGMYSPRRMPRQQRTKPALSTMEMRRTRMLTKLNESTVKPPDE